MISKHARVNTPDGPAAVISVDEMPADSPSRSNSTAPT
ncbi:hypothetical protein STBA_40330 [Streptomyces sp. MP131-18]|nr:hypothetical protein STBA_40330 [Streptomyces sp. MP131-18]